MWWLHPGDVLAAYDSWPTPATIVSDGAYGVRGFHGDTVGVEELVDWYRPHVDRWSDRAGPATTLWFWNTEIGWATVHPLLVRSGWDYVQTIIWDKGLGHIAGNVNGKTIRRFPVVTEICVLYQRRFDIGGMSVQQWIRGEWERSGLPLGAANEACGVRNAATRKYLTKDWLWYWPPGEMMARLADYANQHGNPDRGPYFALNGQICSAKDWEALRYRWQHSHGLTNVWQLPPLHGQERLKGTMRRSAPRVYRPRSSSSTHLNQKPIEAMRRLICAVTGTGDVVWEPFGGLGTAALAAVQSGRRAYVAEIDSDFAAVIERRLSEPNQVLG